MTMSTSPDDGARPPSSRFAFLITNFAAVSTVLTAMAASLSMLFLFAYLSVFDGFLVMTIEYSDVLKLVIIGICIAMILMITTKYMIDIVIFGVSIGNPSKRFIILTTIAIVILSFGPGVSAYFYNRLALAYEIARGMSILLGVAALFLAIKLYSEKTFDFNNIFNITLLIAAFVFAIGVTIGLFVRDEGRNHSVSIRDNDTTIRTIEIAKLVMFTSHHVILFYANTVMVVPTANIIELRSEPSYPTGEIVVPAATPR